MGRHPVAEGALRAMTLAPGIVPLGLLFGAAAVGVGFSPLAATALSALVFAGGAQFATVALLATGAGLAAVTGLVLVINSRYLLLSTATLDLARASAAPRWARVLLALGVVDESFALQAAWAKERAVAAGRADGAEVPGVPDRPASAALPLAGLLAVPATLWLLWCGATLVGAFAGELLPDLAPWGLDYALPGIFVGLLGIFADTRARLVAGLAAVAAAGALAFAGLTTAAVLVVPPLVAFGWGALRERREASA